MKGERMGRKKIVLLLFLFWVVVTSMNITKAVHIDDTSYLEIAQHIMQDPLHPMSGMLNWGDIAEPIHETYNPLLLPYIYALTMQIFGESEIALHAVMSLFSLAALVFFYLLAHKLARENALLLTAAFCLGPIFIPSQNLMLDVPMTAIWLIFFWAILCLNNGQDKLRGYVLAGLMCGIACLTKYTSVVLIPILAIDIVLHRRWKRIWVVGIPFLLLAGWSLLNYFDYGGVHFFTREVRGLGPARVLKSLVEWIICLGALSPFFVWLPPYWITKKSGRILLWACAIITAAVLFYGLAFMDGFGPRAFLRALFVGAGILMLSSVIAILIRPLRNVRGIPDSPDALRCTILLCWFAGPALFIILLAPIVAPRYLLMAFPAALLALGHVVLPETRKVWVHTGLAATILLGVLLGISDWKYADVYRSGAKEIRKIWHQGHWGWQWYADKAGMKQYDTGRTIFRKGDYLIVPLGVHRQNLRKAQSDQIKVVLYLEKPSDPGTIFRTMSVYEDMYGGFYDPDVYRLPWTITSTRLELFFVCQAIAEESFPK